MGRRGGKPRKGAKRGRSGTAGGGRGRGGGHRPKLLPRAAPAKRTRRDREGADPFLQWRDQRPGPALLAEILAAGGVRADELAVNRLWQYHLRLKARNAEINLTRIRRFPDVVVKHFIDCALVGQLTRLPSPLLDAGSGPGFPGVPLKILHPDVSVILCEGRRIRVAFLEEVQGCLRLPGLSILGQQLHPSYAEPVAGVVTRALEVIPKTLVRVRGCLGEGGRVIFMKGPNVDPELDEARSKLSDEYQLVEDHEYTLPLTDNGRRLVVFERRLPPAPQDEAI